MTGLLQDEAEGYECQRLSRWFASRLDARQTVRRFHDPLPPTDMHLLLRSQGRTTESTDATPDLRRVRGEAS